MKNLLKKIHYNSRIRRCKRKSSKALVKHDSIEYERWVDMMCYFQKKKVLLG